MQTNVLPESVEYALDHAHELSRDHAAEAYITAMNDLEGWINEVQQVEDVGEYRKLLEELRADFYQC